MKRKFLTISLESLNESPSITMVGSKGEGAEAMDYFRSIVKVLKKQ